MICHSCHGPAHGALLSAAQFDLISIQLEAAVSKMRAHGVSDPHIQRFTSYFQAKTLPATASDEQQYDIATGIQRHAGLILASYMDPSGHPISREVTVRHQDLGGGRASSPTPSATPSSASAFAAASASSAASTAKRARSNVDSSDGEDPSTEAIFGAQSSAFDVAQGRPPYERILNPALHTLVQKTKRHTRASNKFLGCIFAAEKLVEMNASTFASAPLSFEQGSLDAATQEELRAMIQSLIGAAVPFHASIIALREVALRCLQLWRLGCCTAGANWLTAQQLIYREKQDTSLSLVFDGHKPLEKWDDKVKEAMMACRQSEFLAKDGSLPGALDPAVAIALAKGKGQRNCDADGTTTAGSTSGGGGRRHAPRGCFNKLNARCGGKGGSAKAHRGGKSQGAKRATTWTEAAGTQASAAGGG